MEPWSLVFFFRFEKSSVSTFLDLGGGGGVFGLHFLDLGGLRSSFFRFWESSVFVFLHFWVFGLCFFSPLKCYLSVTYSTGFQDKLSDNFKK